MVAERGLTGSSLLERHLVADGRKRGLMGSSWLEGHLFDGGRERYDWEQLVRATPG